MHSDTDTIYALATPLAKSGVAIIRISGPAAYSTLLAFTGLVALKPRMARTVSLKEPKTGEILDQAVVFYFESPASFTGEDVVEIQCHGSMAVIRKLLNLCSEIPELRLAKPGEFTRRAVENGKMDIVEAEGLRDLIEAESPLQQAQALRQMNGTISRFYNELRRSILQALSLLEAHIDFPDEDLPDYVLRDLSAEITKLTQIIAATLNDHRLGERIREGITVVILGPPNSGKSSILNALAQREAAIVSPIAGTTRDPVEVHLTLSGYSVVLIDTAGLRDTDDPIEAEGIRRARLRASQAAVTLLVTDAVNLQPIDLVHDILLWNKADLPSSLTPPGHAIVLSAKTGLGLQQLEEALAKKIAAFLGSNEHVIITRGRHREALQNAEAHLMRYHKPDALELKCEELRLAAGYIGQITGHIAVDDVLDVIFREFCIGK